ncbi:MAG TPA: hypothetical protein EYO88_07950, partial [Alphaproteobacteria bacterium]|nr:hypothetical protein [Alphaproteobacteria bacterium]
MPQLDPQAKLLIEKAEAAGNPELYELDPPAARKLFLELSMAVAVDPIKVGSVVDQQIPGPTGQLIGHFALGVRRHEAESSQPADEAN